MSADIIIIVDISAGQIGDELKKVINYAQKNKLPFPPIDLTDIDKKTILTQRIASRLFNSKSIIE